ncbi:MAG: 16S rRNA (cytosine(1402)-N(4))-methyltransferase RsmH [Pseudomonadota bacterium]
MAAFEHKSVLHNEVIDALQVRHDSVVVDATYGRGGHAKSIVRALNGEGRLIVIDRDADAIEHAADNYGDDPRIEIVQASFDELIDVIANRNLIGAVGAILFDFGVSSPQLDNPARGFSFNKNGPLDMRMDQTCGQTAAQWLQDIDLEELTRVIKIYGEERYARRIARAVIDRQQASPILTTEELSRIVAGVIPSREPGKHPATRTFQAIRIAINDELIKIEKTLPMALDVLSPGGRLVVISFHSLEDRIVKRFFRDQSRGDPFPPDLPVTTDMLKPSLKLVGKAVRPTEDELSHNPRARSAVLRVAEKMVH